MTDDEFLSQFEAQSLPFEFWNHRAHLKVAYLLLKRYPFAEAVDRIRSGIRAYNAANNVKESQFTGYHETMTQAWMRLAHNAIQRYGPAESADAFFDGQPQLCVKRILRLFYSTERFTSMEAKTSYLEPDIIPLPEPDSK